MMHIFQTLLRGRPNGLRSRIFGKMSGAAPASSTGATGAARREPPARAPDVHVEAAEKSMALHKEPPRDVTPPEGYEVVLHKDALEKGKIIEIIIGGTAIAIANVDGTYYATSNTCAHAEGPLGEGTLEGCIVTCPYHGWQFDVTDGSCKTNPYSKVQTYPVQVVDSAVCVKL